jgi:VRR-NUC domain
MQNIVLKKAVIGNIGKKATKPKKHHLESMHQQAFIQWARLSSLIYRDKREGFIKDYLIAIPNGGARSKLGGAILKAEGVTAGVSDLFFAFPTRTYHGLWIEFKTDRVGSLLTENQQAWLAKMKHVDYQFVVPRNVNEAIDMIEVYLLS